MADDFLPVGIRAVAKDVDDFIADLHRMGQAVTEFGNTVRDTGGDLRTFQTRTEQSSQAMVVMDAVARRTALSSTLLGDAARQAAASLAQLAAGATGQVAAIQATASAATRSSAAHRSLAGH